MQGWAVIFGPSDLSAGGVGRLRSCLAGVGRRTSGFQPGGLGFPHINRQKITPNRFIEGSRTITHRKCDAYN